jgi:hypothetical protein
MTNNKKINISKKIRKFDYLYVNKYDNAYYKTKHQENISKYYNELKKSVNNLVGPNAEPNLYSILLNSFEVDFNTIKFVFNFVDPVIFGLAIDNNILIKQYISKKINNFELYYDQYMYWYKQFIKPDGKSGSKPTNKSNFEEFYNYILNKLLGINDNGKGNKSKEVKKTNSKEVQTNNDNYGNYDNNTEYNQNQNYKQQQIDQKEWQKNQEKKEYMAKREQYNNEINNKYSIIKNSGINN